jgi:hypothetical protein
MICFHCENPIPHDDHYNSLEVFSKVHNKWVTIHIHHEKCRDEFRSLANGLEEYYRRCLEYGENPYSRENMPKWWGTPGFEIESFTWKDF